MVSIAEIRFKGRKDTASVVIFQNCRFSVQGAKNKNERINRSFYMQDTFFGKIRPVENVWNKINRINFCLDLGDSGNLCSVKNQKF